MMPAHGCTVPEAVPADPHFLEAFHVDFTPGGLV
jgi:hypothetical protein